MRWKLTFRILVGVGLVCLSTNLIWSRITTGYWETGLINIYSAFGQDNYHAYHYRQLADKEGEFLFTGRVVFGNGEPVPDAEVVILLHSVYGPKGEKLRKNANYQISRITDKDGFFTVDDTGSFLLVQKIIGPGRFLYEEDISQRDLRVPGNRGYDFHSEGFSNHYEPDANSPAVFVMVRPEEIITTWPSRGGEDVYGSSGKKYVNTPRMPDRPSVPLVETDEGWVYRPEY